MHVSKEFLMEAVGMSLLVALILISMQLFQKATQVTTLLEEGQEKKIQELEEYEIVRYDELVIDGMTAISYIKQMVGTYQLWVEISDQEKSFFITETSDFALLRKAGSEKYISPLAVYQCNVVRNENDIITGIQLRKEQEGE